MIGNLGKDPEQIQSQYGAMCRFTVAVTKKGYTTSSGVQVPEHTEWFNILCNGKNAETALQYLHKGDKVYVEGETFTSEYTDQQGLTKRNTEVRCERFEMLTPKAQQQQPSVQQYAQPVQQYAPQAAPQQVQQPQQYQPAPQAPQYAPQQAPQATGVFGQPVQAPVAGTGRPW